MSRPASPIVHTDTERLEHYMTVVASEKDRLLLSQETDEGPRDTPVWFWENDASDAEYATFREALDADIDTGGHV
jgi:hypothetical protein